MILEPVKKIFEHTLLLILALGGLAWGIVGLFKWSIFAWVAKKTFKSFDTIVYIIVGLAALYFLTSRDFYLPFLGETVFPCEPLAENIPDDADTSITIKVTPNSNVVFWASETDTDDIVDNPWAAYSKFKNSGVTRSNDDGSVTLKVRKPTSYKIPTGKVLKPHIHYRVCKPKGFLSRVETVYL
jgi:uncharacterized membrane protein YuzA (DUF378 family)